MCGECVIGFELVCTSIAKVDSDNGFGVLLVVDFFIVEKHSSCSCNVSSTEKGELFFGILVYVCSSSSLVTSVSFNKRDC